jgi:methionyl-tRNA formyltransferase
MPSVRFVADRNACDYSEVWNLEELSRYFERIENNYFDILISSNSWYLKEEWLNKVRIASLNRHSSLLPSYGGLWPIVHNALAGEEFFGVSVHKMTYKVDRGPVLSQQKILSLSGETIYSRYSKAFKCSGELIRDAIEKCYHDELPNQPNYQSSYFGKLKRGDLSRLKALGVSFI